MRTGKSIVISSLIKRIVYLCILFVLSITIKVQGQSSAEFADKIAIRQIIEQWKDGYNNGESSKVAALYIKDAYYLTQHFVTGIVHGRAAIQAYIQRGAAAQYHIDSIRTIMVDISGDFAYTITRYDADNGGQKVFGVNVVVLKKIEGEWFIVAHEAAVPDLATAIQRLDTLNLH